MNTYFLLTTVALFALTFYTAELCLANRQIPPSLSASVFFLPPSGAWIWTLTMAIMVFCLAPVLIATASESLQWCAFLACAGLLFVGGAPLVKNKTDMAYRVHCSAAVVCAVFAMILVIATRWWLAFGWLPWLYWFIWQTRDRRWRTQTFWAEMTCFGLTFLHAYLNIV